MMVDAQSKVRTNPGYSGRRAQEALNCYEGNRPTTRQAANPPPNPPTLGCPAASTGALSSPKTDGAEASVVLAQYSGSGTDLASPWNWDQWMKGTPDGITPGLRDVLYKVWSDKIKERKYGTPASFDPRVGPLRVSRNWKYLWSTCPAQVKFLLRCYANNISVKPVHTYCVILREPTFSSNDWINWTFWMFLKDYVLTSDVLRNSDDRIPFWPDPPGEVGHDPSGRYYVNVEYTFSAVVKAPIALVK
jgi:hypothetical protein